MPTLRLGTRRSALAQAQARFVADELTLHFPALKIELVLITTSGDQSTEPTSTLPSGGLKAMFTKEIEEALLAHKIDLAVHSMKDLPSTLPKGLVIGAVPVREDPRDVWISKTHTAFAQTPSGARIGTDAVRRRSQLRHLRPDLRFEALRGNVDTRLRKLAEGTLDGIVLAYAGLRRLHRDHEITEHFSIEDMIPAAGQGALAIEIRQGDKAVQAFIKPLNHIESEQAVAIEREFLHELGGACQTPIAGYARKEDRRWVMEGRVASVDGILLMTERRESPSLKNLGQDVARALIHRGASRLLRETRLEPPTTYL